MPLCRLEGPEGGIGVPLVRMLKVSHPISNERWPESALTLFALSRPTTVSGGCGGGGGGGNLYLEPLHVEGRMDAVMMKKKKRKRVLRAIQGLGFGV